MFGGRPNRRPCPYLQFAIRLLLLTALQRAILRIQANMKMPKKMTRVSIGEMPGLNITTYMRNSSARTIPIGNLARNL